MKNQKNKPKVLYYSDELNDDFAGTNINTKAIDNNFKFIHKSPVWRFFSNLLYYFVAIPVVYIFSVWIKRVRFVNKKAIKQAKNASGGGVFLYGNHTGVIDAFTPNLISFPKRNKIIVGADTVSIPGIKNITQMLGALPLPTGTNGMQSFVKAVSHYNKTCNITIYPEAHIWPYYTGVRNFKDSSFRYAILTNSPVIAFFTAYRKPKGLFKHLRKANITVYVSDPIYPNTDIPKKEAQKELRDKVFKFMKTCSEKYSTHKVIEYKHISKKGA